MERRGLAGAPTYFRNKKYSSWWLTDLLKTRQIGLSWARWFLNSRLTKRGTKATDIKYWFSAVENSNYWICQQIQLEHEKFNQSVGYLGSHAPQRWIFFLLLFLLHRFEYIFVWLEQIGFLWLLCWHRIILVLACMQ